MADPTDHAPLPLTGDYTSARNDFLARASDASIASFEHPVLGPEGTVLATDVAWIGPPDAADVVVVVSGTHGVEGFAGSALQRTWLRDRTPGLPDGMAIALVHALNPYGFAVVRRVNEDNVDLNRNFPGEEGDAFGDPPANPAYESIAELVVPPTWDERSQQETTEALLDIAARESFETLQQWVSGGQYSHPDGVFYGGVAPVWSHTVLDAIVDGQLAGRERVAVIDLHTGLGPWGVGELISSDGPDDPAYRRAVAWYGDDVTSLLAGDSVSAELSGEWLPYVDRRLAQVPTPTEATSVALEFGTVDTITVLQALRADAWLHAHGDPDGPDATNIKAQVRAAFADDDPAWIAALWERFAFVLGRAFTNLGSATT